MLEVLVACFGKLHRFPGLDVGKYEIIMHNIRSSSEDPSRPSPVLDVFMLL